MADRITVRLTDQQTQMIHEEAKYTGVPEETVLAAIFTHGLSVWIELRERINTINIMGAARRNTRQAHDLAVGDASKNDTL